MATPAKPLTPFFLFREKEKQKGKNLGAKEAADLWNNMKEEEKKPINDEYNKNKAKYDAYLAEEGKSPKRSSIKGAKENYSSGKVRALLGESEDIKEISSEQAAALGKMAVI